MGSIPGRFFTAVLAIGVLTLTGCGTAALPEQRIADAERQSVLLTDHPDAVAALRDSSYRIGAAMLAADPEGNQVTSPVSALAALAMLRVGARTTTAAEMDSVLGLPAEHRDEAMNALLAAWAAHDGDPATVDGEEPPEEPLLHLANGLFPAEDLPLEAAFLEPLAQHYGTGVYPVDYRTGGALDGMNAWVNHHTGGRIEEVPIEPSERTRLNIINTVYFAAAWADPFDPQSTETGPFRTSSSLVQTPLMYTVMPLKYADGDGWQGVDLPYNNGFVMRLILPEEGTSPVLDEAALAQANKEMDDAGEGLVALTLPSWDHSYDLDLKEVLTTMGLEEAMGETPDFSGISADGLYVEGAAQSANITVAEKGTIAAAVTQISMAESGFAEPDVEITFDRPFLYQILHEDTGMPLFLGTVMDPGTQ
ncbi:serpin family protein [Arthrobacter tumbae]|uniref:serpin family protein n=1 Tax=Arthrobacter tumbae TaxID=163874 RepID=UPI00195F1110|nr:serpin family protein [Arthrobacter tumbae]MBM7782608.1 serpin B [Arthrobacter tumbae]